MEEIHKKWRWWKRMKCLYCENEKKKNKKLAKGNFWCWHCFHWVDNGAILPQIERCYKCGKEQFINHYW